MEPTKYPQNEEGIIFSKRLESSRKDVECFFGRVKGRSRILKLSLLLQHKEVIDNVWFTCCILHNLLHSFDGLGELEAGVDWAGREGLYDAWIADPETGWSSVGIWRCEKNEKTEVETSHEALRNTLLTSFTYRARHNDIVWLSRKT